jgi:TPR repeat protein
MVPGQCKAGQKAANARAPKVVDPMRAIRNRMLAGDDVPYRDLQRLADSGDDLGAFYLAKQLETTGDPERLDTAGHYYLRALYDGRTAALRPTIRLLKAGAFDEAPGNLADARKILERLAAEGNADARDGLIAMYRSGVPFGAHPERADELLAASADAGDGKAAFDLAVALLSGAPAPEQIDRARGYLEVAALSETLNIRTMAENMLRNLEPQRTASTEIVQ